MKLTILKEYDLRIPLGQVRSCEVDLGYEKVCFLLTPRPEMWTPVNGC